VAAKDGQKTLSNAAFGNESAHGIGEFMQSGAGRANRKDGARLAKHATRVASGCEPRQSAEQRLSDGQKKKRPPFGKRF
jgi:hypothetical protein